MKTKFQITKNGVLIEEHESLIDAYWSMREKIIDQATYLTYVHNIPSAAIVCENEIYLDPLSLREVELKDGVYKIQIK